MIYTVTFNPSLDYVMKTSSLDIGHTNRSAEEYISVGGKGINVSLVLSELGIESTALGFVGGFTGTQLEQMLERKLVKTDFVRVAGGNTRINVKLIADEMTEVNAAGPFISDEEINALISKTDGLVAGDTLVIAGSVPKNLSDDIYEKILGRIFDRNVKIVVDATGDLLLKTLRFKPFLIKPNVDELGALFGVDIKDEDEIIKYALRLHEMGAQNVLVSMGKEGAILVDSNLAVRKRTAIGCGAVNPVGAGDSMVAGFIAGAKDGYEKALELGIACGGATACSQGLATKDQIDCFLAMMK